MLNKPGGGEGVTYIFCLKNRNDNKDKNLTVQFPPPLGEMELPYEVSCPFLPEPVFVVRWRNPIWEMIIKSFSN